MEVNALGQGRQNTFDYDSSSSVNLVNNDKQNNSGDVDTSARGETADVKDSPKQDEISSKDVKKAVDKVNKLLEDKNTHLEYEEIGKSKVICVKIVDDSTKQVIKEIPPKKIVEMIDKLCELAGIMVDEKA